MLLALSNFTRKEINCYVVWLGLQQISVWISAHFAKYKMKVFSECSLWKSKEYTQMQLHHRKNEWT